MKLKKQKYIAAVSGGPDSMALLNKFKKYIVGVCHVNYHKRVDSDYDTNIVTNYCLTNKIPLLIENVNKQIYKDAKQHNFQALARDIRYDFFIRCAKEFKCFNLLIAHNLNDFLETAIMQQKRNSKNFFYGIKSENKYKSLNIYRPLIGEFKKDLESYCKTNKIPYAIDSSNESDIYERNRVRKQLNKLSKVKLLALYRKFDSYNKKQAKVEKKINSLLFAWAKTGYKVNFINSVDKGLVDSLIYVYLKNNNIINVNYNKIKLVRDYIVSKKSNNHLRVTNDIWLKKTNKRIKIYQHDKTK